METSLLSQIDITLQDYKNHTLLLTFGQPTIVVLEFKKMRKRKEFILRVESTKDPFGTPGDFQVDLPPGMSLDPHRKWDVALTSMIYNGSFAKFPSETKNVQQYFTVEIDRDTRRRPPPPPA